jgi:hypothetical protein
MTKISWKETAELVGLMAIVASLMALVVELRQTQSAMLAGTYQSRAIDAIGEALYIADSNYLVPILVATNNGGDYEAVANLNAGDRMRLFHYLRARMVNRDNEHYQYQKGYLSADFFEGTTTLLVKEMAPRWRSIGLTEKREEFREYVDRVLSEVPEGTE